jgi:hypothetical protein
MQQIIDGTDGIVRNIQHRLFWECVPVTPPDDISFFGIALGERVLFTLISRDQWTSDDSNSGMPLS